MRVFLSILLVVLLVPTYDSEPTRLVLGRDAVFVTHHVPLSVSFPELKRVGRLTYLGGIQLIGGDPAFGGFSSMTVVGDRFTLLSDGGNIVSFAMTPDWHISDRHFGDLPGGPGKGIKKIQRDSESLTRDPATGQLWVGFEAYNQIWRYAPGFARAERHAAPWEMDDWPSSGGAEAMVRLHDGPFVVLSEMGHWGKRPGRYGIWFAKDPTIDQRRGFRFSYVPPAHFDVSDMAELPNGDLMVLNRRFQLPYVFTARLTIVKRADIRPGAIVHGVEVARFEGPIIHDNFEALAITRDHDQTIVWIASDDNQSLLQRSLLLKFRLD